MLGVIALALACRTPTPAPRPEPSQAKQAPQESRVIVETLTAPSHFLPFVDIDPKAATVAPGGTIAFHAAMNYPEGKRYIRQPVTWQVLEPDGGTITMNGLYTAPAVAGTNHVKVTRTDPEGLGLSYAATVTVK
jgi:hypothetical protein